MTEAYTSPDTDPFHVQEAKLLAQRIFLHVGQDPNFDESLGLKFCHQVHFYKPRTCDVWMEYFPMPEIALGNGSSWLEDPSFDDLAPAVTFMVTHEHKGLHHSTMGPDVYVPDAFFGNDGILYGAYNEFFINSLGQSRRVDKLFLLFGPVTTDDIEDSYEPQLDLSPKASDLCERVNLFDPSDYEMIGHYLNQIEQGELIKVEYS
jgi:hypothetical protein